jgi:hypothetical protein
MYFSIDSSIPPLFRNDFMNKDSRIKREDAGVLVIPYLGVIGFTEIAGELVEIMQPSK